MSRCMKCGTPSKTEAQYCKACGAAMDDATLRDKKARVMADEKKWIKPAIVAAVAVIVLAGAWFGNGIYRRNSMSGGQAVLEAVRDASATTVNAEIVKAQDGAVRIPLASVSDGNAHFFSYAAATKTVRFFVMKAGDGSIRTALDACVACNHAKLGYRQESGMVVCNNCGMAFKPSDIGAVTGGCNPIPITGTTDGPMIVVNVRELEAGTRYF